MRNARLAASAAAFLTFMLLCAPAARADMRFFMPPADSGLLGAGQKQIAADSFPDPFWHAQKIYVYAPLTGGKLPVIFFCHGINQTDPRAYESLLRYMAAQGCIVIYAPYTAVPVSNDQRESYALLMRGFEAGAARFRDRIDTSQAGFVGHSFGGGAVPFIAWQWLVTKRWGSRKACMFMMAPWYVCNFSRDQFKRFPQHVYLAVQVYDEDGVNDHRIAKDFFECISIPDSQKCYQVLYSDSIPGYRLSADHSVPVCTSLYGGDFNVLDAYGVNRTFGWLSARCFVHDTMAQRLLLGKTGSADTAMGFWQDGRPVVPMRVEANPAIEHPQKYYINFWDHSINPRSAFHSAFGESRPLFYATRMTLRNYWYTIVEALRNRRMEKSSRIARACAQGPIISGLGANGPFFMDTDSIQNPNLHGSQVFFFSPRDAGDSLPVVLFFHAFRQPDPRHYRQLIEHIVSRGYCVIFASSWIYELDMKNKQRYDALLQGCDEAIELHRRKIDLNRIGFFGHSFGGGAVPAIAWNYLAERHWGQKGSFLFIAAPWFAYNITQDQLEHFPDRTKMIMQVYDNDKTNDWRIAQDIFENLAVPPSEKNFIALRSDTNGACRLIADHGVPLSSGGSDADVNALDYYGVYRLFDALADYAFTGNDSAKAVALGNGSDPQRTMGQWQDGKSIRQWEILSAPYHFPRRRWLHSWDSYLNERKNVVTSRDSGKK
jgi:hypothetical protein